MNIHIVWLLVIIVFASIVSTVYVSTKEQFKSACVKSSPFTEKTDFEKLKADHQKKPDSDEDTGVPECSCATKKVCGIVEEKKKKIEFEKIQKMTPDQIVWNNLQVKASEDNVIQTPWACQKIQNYTADESTFTDGYVIARKNMNGVPECVITDDKSDKDYTNKCTLFKDQTTCENKLFNAASLKPETCKDEEMIYPEKTCTQLKRNTWQCRRVNKDTYYAVRKQDGKDIECLGYSFDTCKPFSSFLECNNNMANVKSDRYLKCGEMMYELHGTDGYSKDNHHCKLLKDMVI